MKAASSSGIISTKNSDGLNPTSIITKIINEKEKIASMTKVNPRVI